MLTFRFSTEGIRGRARALALVSASAAALSLPLLAPSSALAQAQTAAASGTSDMIETVTVTAQFRKENLQATPLAITAIDASQMEARSETNIIQAANTAPNVTLVPSQQGWGNSAGAFIRGIGQSDFNFALEPGVGMYIDDVYFGTVFGTEFGLLDLDRVEIERGPQGTLSGKNSIGGSIKLYSKKPDDQGGGYIEAGYGSLNSLDARAGADFVLVPDKLFARISASFNRRDGFLTELDYACANPGSGLPATTTQVGCKIGNEGGLNDAGVRAALRYVVSSSVEDNLIFDYTAQDDQPSALKLVWAPTQPANFYYPGSPVGWARGYNFLTGPHDYSNYSNFIGYSATGVPFNVPRVSTMYGWGVGNTIDWNLGGGYAVKAITAYRSYNGAFSFDGSAAPIDEGFNYNVVNHTQFSQELRINGTSFGNAVEWTVGGYYYTASSNLAGRIELNAVVPGLDFLDNDPVDQDSESGFAHAVWHVTDKLNLTGGVRYTAEAKSYTFTRLNPDGTPNAILGSLNGVTGKYAGNRFDYRADVDYQWTPDFMTYAQFSTGFKGGGINPRPFFPFQVVPFAPETLTAYEVGFKSDWFDHHARLNMAAFYNEYNRIQQTLLACPAYNPPPLAGVALPCAAPANVGNAIIQGVELETEIHPLPGLSIDGSVGYLDFSYSYLDPALITGLVKGMVNPFSPRWKANLGIQYDIEMGAIGSLTPRLDYDYQDTIYTNAVNAPTNRISSHDLFNARLTYRDADDKWEAALSVENLMNRFYYLTLFDEANGYGPGTGEITGQPGLPRTVMFTVKRNF